MSILLDLLSWVLLLAGGGIAIVAGYGVVRLPDVYTRMHAASMLDSLGALCVFLGLALQTGMTLMTLKLGIAYSFLLLTTAVAAHILGKSAIKSGLEPLSGPMVGSVARPNVGQEADAG
ncbi:MAG: monovalent cation/H(+) antiporter subunit G [Planctomycetota bacterium]